MATRVGAAITRCQSRHGRGKARSSRQEIGCARLCHSTLVLAAGSERASQAGHMQAESSHEVATSRVEHKATISGARVTASRYAATMQGSAMRHPTSHRSARPPAATRWGTNITHRYPAAEAKPPSAKGAIQEARIDHEGSTLATKSASTIGPPISTRLSSNATKRTRAAISVHLRLSAAKLRRPHTRRANSAASPTYDPGVIASSRSFSAAGISSVPMKAWIDSRVMVLPRVSSFRRSYGLGRL